MADAASPPAPIGKKLGPFDRWLMAADAAVVLWLWFARCSFLGADFSWWPDAIVVAAAVAIGARRLGLHRPPSEVGWAGLLGRSALLALGLSALVGIGGALHVPPIGVLAAAWFGIATGVLLFIFRLGFWAARSAWPDQPWEVARWLVLGLGATLLLSGFYTPGSTGSGDAYWYVIMLADFVTQLHHGVFPVWIGQSEFAFNGAVSPLRLAPWYQYMGGLLDLATAHRLEPTALKNAELGVNALAIAASAYFSLRAMLARRPNVACLLALLWLASPGVLVPLFSADQYMQFMAMPFLPPLLLGCWRLWIRDDRSGRLLIVVALSGLLLSHTPTALWGMLLAGGIYAVQLVLRRHWLAECRRLAWMAALFAVLGALPVGSALTIDHPVSVQIPRAQVAVEIASVFPANFKPIDLHRSELEGYQLGYALIAAGVVALGLLVWLRPRGAALFPVAMLIVAPLTLPVPWLTNWLWSHAPNLVVAIDNVWPMQRLFAVWALLLAFTLAVAAADRRISGHRRRVQWLLAMLLAGGVWSASEACKLDQALRGSTGDETSTEVSLRPENLHLTRYAYASFATVPPYVSHGYMEPELENRLLDRRSLAVMTANADAAAPRIRPDSEPATLPRLVQSGVWTATSDNHSAFYLLRPLLRLEPRRHYALRLDFFHPDYAGVLQIISDGNAVFREYLLPDSGAGLARTELSQAFGSLPTSSPIIPLRQSTPDALEPGTQQLILNHFSGEQFDFARYWLFSYDPADLPVRILSWVPYRAETETAVPAFLETPRIWQRGWRAEVNGRPAAVQQSPHNLVMIPIEPGAGRVVLTFRPPLWLSAWFWVCFAGWVLVSGYGAGRLVRRARSL